MSQPRGQQGASTGKDSTGRRFCYHCELPVTGADAFLARLAGSEHVFCCPGCAAAAQLIVSSGLGSYYDYRAKSAPLPSLVAAPVATPDTPDYSRFDDPALANSFVVPGEDGEREASLIISGIRCAACVWLLERYLGEQEGMKSVNVSLASQRAFLRFDASRVGAGQIFSWIHALGYEAHPYRPGTAERLHEAERARRIKELGFAGIVLMQVMMFSITFYAARPDGMVASYRSLFQWASLALATPLLLYSGASFYRSAWRDLKGGVAGMDLPVAIALTAAWALSAWHTVRASGETYFDSIAMFTFFLLLGRYLEFQARFHSSRSANELVSVFPASALRLAPGTGTGEASETVAVEQLAPGDRVLVAEGGIVPADGVLCEDAAEIDRSMLSGESAAVTVPRGGTVLAGSLNLGTGFVLEITRTTTDSVVSGILRLSERAAADKPAVASLANRVAARFVVTVLIIAAVAAAFWGLHDADRALPIVLSVLVISCPCALSLAIPTALTVATYRLADIGFLIVSGHVLERLAAVRRVVFDKTGTLTRGMPVMSGIDVLGDVPVQECLDIAAALERGLAHPLARAFTDARGHRVEERHHTAGQGVEGRIGDRAFRLGRPSFACPDSIPGAAAQAGSTVILAESGRPLVRFHLTDQLRADSSEGVSRLRGFGVDIALITGDNLATARQIAGVLAIDKVHAELTPEGKMAYVAECLAQDPELVMVGDGINDIAALKLATTSVVVKDASDFVQASSDAIILSNRIGDLARAVQMARRTRRIVFENLAWAVLYNAIALPIAVAGWVEPWVAALGMSASSLAVVGNSMRLHRAKF